MSTIINIFSTENSNRANESSLNKDKLRDSVGDFKLAADKKAYERAVKSIIDKASQLGW